MIDSDGGVAPCLLPSGFRTAGVACGIKDDPTTLDLALFVADGPVAAAGVFTANRVCGAPVKVSRERVPGEDVRAVVINSGNANACTGARGIADANADNPAEPSTHAARQPHRHVAEPTRLLCRHCQSCPQRHGILPHFISHACATRSQLIGAA